MKHIKLIAGVMFALMLVLSACGPQPAQIDAENELVVTVSVLPQKYFVERIGGEHVAVNVMVAPGASPATYEPTPEQMAALSESAAYYNIGVAFEDVWLDKIAAANEDMVIVDTTAGIERISMVEHEHEDEHADEDHEDEHEGEHEDGHEDDHEEGGLDPHVWTSPEMVKIMSQSIYENLVDLDPANADEFKTNLDAFVAEIDTLEDEISGALAGLEGEKFFVFHPAWGYFARDFGLVQVPIEVGGTEPSASELAELIDEAKHEGAKVIFVQPEFSTRSAETIAEEIGGSVVLISPLEEDWMSNLSKVAEAFSSALGQ